MQFPNKGRLAFLNFLRGKYESWTGEHLVRSYPSYLGIDPTSICQLRCPHCPTGVENEARRLGEPHSFRERTMLDLELFDALLDEVGDYLFLIMFYNWGEPLLYKNLPSLIAKARARGIYTEIHSNLSLRLPDSQIEALLTSGLDELSASIDGFSQETYETYRRGGDFELARDNLERLARIRDELGLETRLVWAFLVFSFNEHEIEAARKYCEARGIIFNRREAYTDNPDWLPSYRKGQLDPPPPPPETPDVQPAAAAASPAAPRAPRPCGWHYSYSVVNADGSVSPCCAPWEQKEDFGTLVKGRVDFGDVWNNELFQKSRAAFANREVEGLERVDTICLRCPFGEGVQRQYDGLDVHVTSQLERLPRGSDPLLERAFELLGDPPAFVEFFARHLADDFSAEPPAGGGTELRLEAMRGAARGGRLSRGSIAARSLLRTVRQHARMEPRVLLRKVAGRLRRGILGA